MIPFKKKSAVKKALASSLLAAALGISQTAAAGTLSLAHTTWVGYGTLYLARDLGYFKEQGLEVKLQAIEEASMYMAAQASGNLDGAASTIDEVLKYRPNMCFKSVIALDDSFGGDGIVTGNDVKSLKDLKGTKVAVNEGSVSQFWLSYLLEKDGMTMDDLIIQNMTADDAASAFIAGRVPTAVTWEPHLSLVRNNKAGKVLVDSSQTPGVIVDVVELNCDVIEKRPEDVKALVAGIYKAVEFTKENPEKAYEIMAKGVGGYLADPAEFAAAAANVRFYDKAMNEALMSPSGEIKELVEIADKTWSKLQGRDLNVSYDDLVDSSFLAQ
ncbi:MAG: taurine ABC transporter substrate-binding protein [Oceanospirillaceae bacterium]|uniref:ABC transporter substrate-binding protein n=1 Tax=unclassified Thalassolituus TaxID=2624967 RepID=UPI000C091D1D|nr:MULTISPECIES: ABC transporter substrate-binding protein [unclassified Thalassolituus]MAK92865.1 taurine ABC transporter substrate-binding protein [Thalassolituus sp.]MAS24264.1 taurine ABC transporter substrate-binding protein [Oceanospirillaceae bacterium]MAX98496.1 taurine ABC transporter substrate-binding protein [Oceanospirillaceae bacterium]MBL33452.1 taurine ABC transporter substrate-binding protein [Oceanospirillaceae bacterium]MBS54288.1 taurine ABC transporter substrate-binding pro|tara:strand:+ start:569 stop:1552 length:984 start_codon:yes stop_codon:yes gene_type:complete